MILEILVWLIVEMSIPQPIWPEPIEDTILSDYTLECMKHECDWLKLRIEEF
jgi:hypothetical protein